MRFFLYCRKSQEAEDRQVLSLSSQRAEAEGRLGCETGVEIVAVFEEAKSAKAPGRPIFNTMMARIEAGEAEGIIAWAPDRLARNSVDGGRIVYCLDTGALRDLKFLTYTFENNPQGKFMLNIMFGQSKYYSDALSENVKRGNRTKAARGWRPNTAPFGYRHDKATRTITVDPVYFPLIRRMFDLALTGGYSSRKIARIAAEDWALRSPTHWKRGGKALSTSTVHRILTNPFYAGTFTVQGEEYVGRHQAMLSPAEFELVQATLRRPSAIHPSRHSFPLTGLIRCGSCHRSVTAEHKVNRHGTRYTYYHCSKSGLGPRCPEPSIRAEQLERQFVAWLRSVELGASQAKRLTALLETYEGGEATAAPSVRLSVERSLRDARNQATELQSMRERSLITDEEFLDRRSVLKAEIVRLTGRLEELARPVEITVIPPLKVGISLNNQAADLFEHGDNELRRQIVRTVCSNPRLTNKILRVEAAYWLAALLELGRCPAVRGWRDGVRTQHGLRHALRDVLFQLLEQRDWQSDLHAWSASGKLSCEPMGVPA